MGRYTGPTEKLSRREGVELELKGARRMARKGGLERRGDAPPGQHGNARRRRESVYGLQLREKQRAKRYYGMREKQLRKTYREAQKGREGQYRVRLMDNTKAVDCAYPGVEILPDGTFVATTYGHWAAGEAPYIVSVRFKLSELDAKEGKE